MIEVKALHDHRLIASDMIREADATAQARRCHAPDRVESAWMEYLVSAATKREANT